MISFYFNVVMDIDVMSRRDCVLFDMLRYNEEVKFVKKKLQYNFLY